MKHTFASRLTEAIEISGRTQREIAHATGISLAYINRLKKGHVTNPSLETVERLARFLGVAMADLTEQPVTDTLAEDVAVYGSRDGPDVPARLHLQPSQQSVAALAKAREAMDRADAEQDPYFKRQFLLSARDLLATALNTL
jgi:transcriptional regulator with XRE-family HTH domain